MKITRIDDGEYVVSHGDKRIKVFRGASRRWFLQPLEGMDFEEKEADSYADGKKKAARMIMSAPKGKASAAASGVSRRGPDVLAAIEDVESRLADIKKALAK